MIDIWDTRVAGWARPGHNNGYVTFAKFQSDLHASFHQKNMTDRMSDSICMRQYGHYCHITSELSQRFTIVDNCHKNSQLLIIVTISQNCHTCHNCHLSTLVKILTTDHNFHNYLQLITIESQLLFVTIGNNINSTISHHFDTVIIEFCDYLILWLIGFCDSFADSQSQMS